MLRRWSFSLSSLCLRVSVVVLNCLFGVSVPYGICLNESVDSIDGNHRLETFRGFETSKTIVWGKSEPIAQLPSLLSFHRFGRCRHLFLVWCGRLVRDPGQGGEQLRELQRFGEVVVHACG